MTSNGHIAHQGGTMREKRRFRTPPGPVSRPPVWRNLREDGRLLPPDYISLTVRVQEPAPQGYWRCSRPDRGDGDSSSPLLLPCCRIFAYTNIVRAVEDDFRSDYPLGLVW